MKQRGQIIIILLLGMLVALTIGLAIVQNSSTDLSFSTKSEQSSRAFSAAEAGIEYALFPGTTTGTTINLQNDAKAEVDLSELLPIATSPQAIEYPPISRSKIAQFWLADPNTQPPGSIPTRYYTLNNVYIYFGSCTETSCPIDPNDKPAIEATIIYWDNDNSRYDLRRIYYDTDSARAGVNPNWVVPGPGECSDSGFNIETVTSTPQTSKFYCKVQFTMNQPGIEFRVTFGLDVPVLLRIRPLYSQTAQKIGVATFNIAPPSPQNGKLPPQVNVITSKGTSGQTERTLKGFKALKVIPNLFDYGVFSIPSITK